MAKENNKRYRFTINGDAYYRYGINLASAKRCARNYAMKSHGKAFITESAVEDSSGSNVYNTLESNSKGLPW